MFKNIKFIKSDEHTDVVKYIVTTYVIRKKQKSDYKSNVKTLLKILNLEYLTFLDLL